jgi:hypothetical protein
VGGFRRTVVVPQPSDPPDMPFALNPIPNDQPILHTASPSSTRPAHRPPVPKHLGVRASVGRLWLTLPRTLDLSSGAVSVSKSEPGSESASVAASAAASASESASVSASASASATRQPDLRPRIRGPAGRVGEGGDVLIVGARDNPDAIPLDRLQFELCRLTLSRTL